MSTELRVGSFPPSNPKVLFSSFSPFNAWQEVCHRVFDLPYPVSFLCQLFKIFCLSPFFRNLILMRLGILFCFFSLESFLRFWESEGLDVPSLLKIFPPVVLSTHSSVSQPSSPPYFLEFQLHFPETAPCHSMVADTAFSLFLQHAFALNFIFISFYWRVLIHLFLCGAQSAINAIKCIYI